MNIQKIFRHKKYLRTKKNGMKATDILSMKPTKNVLEKYDTLQECIYNMISMYQIPEGVLQQELYGFKESLSDDSKYINLIDKLFLDINNLKEIDYSVKARTSMGKDAPSKDIGETMCEMYNDSIRLLLKQFYIQVFL